MTNSRAINAIATAAVFLGLTYAVWILTTTFQDCEAVPRSLTETEAQRRERFFGGVPEKDLHGGQEMRPRW